MSSAQVTSVKRPFSLASAELLDHVDYRLIETEADRDVIYRLRYRAYLQEGAIDPNSEGKVYDRYDDDPYTWIFAVYLHGQLAGSIRISVATPDHPSSPSVDVFPDLLMPELKRGKVIVDPTRFVADPDLARRHPELPYVTVRLGYVACSYFDADIGLATVRAEHQAFYRRMFLQTSLSPPRVFPSLVKPVCLMAADYHATRERVFERYPFFRSSYFERRMLFERRAEAAAVRSGFVERPYRRATIVPCP